MKKIISGIMMTLIFIGMLTLAFDIQPVKASGTIYIRADGSIDPPTAPIQRDGDIYTFTDNIYDGIVVERSNIIIDGDGYTVLGNESGNGFDLTSITNVTIQNTNIKGFNYGISLSGSNNISISGNNITANNMDGFWQSGYCDYNNISRNNLANNRMGIYLSHSWTNDFSGNNITNNWWCGVYLDMASFDNIISGNNIKNNEKGIFLHPTTSGNKIYHNNFINNTQQVYIPWALVNGSFWDDGYPSGGNYWSDYTDKDLYCGPNQNIPTSDGIWDHKYVIDSNNRDNYPLVKSHVPGNLTVSIYTDKTIYHVGDVMHLGLNASNPDSVKYLCFAIWVKLPSSSIYLYMHEHSLVLPIGLNYANPSFQSIKLPNLPPGNYTWHATFLERATHKIIVEDTAEWKFTTAYDRLAAYNYAQKYWDEVCSDGYFWNTPTTYISLSPGTNITTMTGYDCAHFVSCCIGNEPNEPGGGLDVPSRVPPTYGEPGAARLGNWLIESGNGVEKTSITELEMGDVINYDWDGDGHWDHIALYLGNNEVAAHTKCVWKEDWRLGGAANYRFIHITV